MKHGMVEIADGGTLFVDEVADMSSSLQSKLLRILETGEFRRVGGREPGLRSLDGVCLFAILGDDDRSPRHFCM